MKRRSFLISGIASLAGLFGIKKTQASVPRYKTVYKIWFSGVIYYVVAERLSEVFEAVRKQLPDPESLETEMALYGSMWVRLEPDDHLFGMPCEFIVENRKSGEVFAVGYYYSARRQSK